MGLNKSLYFSIYFLALAFLGTFGGEGYTTLVESGYTLITIPCYGLVIICGFGVLFRIPYAAIVAALATIIEFGLYVGIYMHIHWQVHYLMMLKFAVFVCCSQLLVTCLKKVVQEKTIRYVEPEGVPQAHKRTLYTQQVHQVDADLICRLSAVRIQGRQKPQFLVLVEQAHGGIGVANIDGKQHKDASPFLFCIFPYLWYHDFAPLETAN